MVSDEIEAGDAKLEWREVFCSVQRRKRFPSIFIIKKKQKKTTRLTHIAGKYTGIKINTCLKFLYYYIFTVIVLYLLFYNYFL